MAEGLNKVMLIGNLGQDPELRYTAGKQAVMNMRIATTDSYYDDKQQKRIERTEWHTVILWGKRAEALEKILTKGGRVYIEGRLQTRKWEDKEGKDRYTTEVVASNLLLLGGKSAGGSSGREDTPPPGDGDSAGAPADDDIPF